MKKLIVLLIVLSCTLSSCTKLKKAEEIKINPKISYSLLGITIENKDDIEYKDIAFSFYDSRADNFSSNLAGLSPNAEEFVPYGKLTDNYGKQNSFYFLKTDISSFNIGCFVADESSAYLESYPFDNQNIFPFFADIDSLQATERTYSELDKMDKEYIKDLAYHFMNRSEDKISYVLFDYFIKKYPESTNGDIKYFHSFLKKQIKK